MSESGTSGSEDLDNEDVFDNAANPADGENMAGINAEQLAQILAAARGGGTKKVETLSSTDSSSWQTWRSNFVICVAINQWNNARARREAAASMVGTAKEYVRDIPIGDANVAGGNDAAPVAGLLDLYQARFTPAAESDLARVTLKDAKQRPEEGIMAWHARVRVLYSRAFPHVAAPDLETARNLMDAFILGLYEPEIRKDTWKARPQTYTDCLQSAQNNAAALSVLSGGKRDGSAAVDPAVFHLGQVDARAAAISETCYVCNRAGHWKRDCPLAKAIDARRQTYTRGGYRGRGNFKKTKNTNTGKGSFGSNNFNNFGSNRGRGRGNKRGSYNKTWRKDSGPSRKVSQISGDDEVNESIQAILDKAADVREYLDHRNGRKTDDADEGSSTRRPEAESGN